MIKFSILTVLFITIIILATSLPPVKRAINTCVSATNRQQHSQSYTLIADSNNNTSNVFACLTALNN